MPTQSVRVAIDLETTGLLAEQDSIIEIGAVKFAGADVLDTFESFVAYRPALPYRVQRLTGIRSSDLRDAPTLADLSGSLRAFLADLPLVGHSVSFDVAFLRRTGLARRNPQVDTYELASMLLPDLPSYSLEAVGAALGLSSPVYHRALADAVLAKDVFLTLLDRLDALDPATLRVLGRLSAGTDWTPGYFVQAALRRQGISLAPAGGLAPTLGAQFAAKLGLDPAVLGLAVARGSVEEDAAQPETPARARVLAPVAAMPATGTEASSAATGIMPDAPEPAGSAPTLDGEAPSPGDELAVRTHAASAMMLDCLEHGGAALIEIEMDEDGVLAVLEPVLRCAMEGTRVVVAAADSAGAARVLRSAIPRVLARLDLTPDAVRVAEVDVRASYLCLHRWLGTATLARDGSLSRELARGLAKVAVWSRDTLSGARREVALTGQELAAWDRARSGREFADSAAGCAYVAHGYCFVARAQQAAESAQLIVTTHAALAEQLVGFDSLLPPTTRIAVLDAHLLEDRLRDAASWSLERAALLGLLADLAQTERGGARSGLFHLAAGSRGDAPEPAWFGQVARARGAAQAFFAALAKLLADAQHPGSKSAKHAEVTDQPLRLDAHARRLAAWPEVKAAGGNLRARLAAVSQLARQVATSGTPAGTARQPLAADGVASDLLGASRVLEAICEQLDGVLVQEQAGMVTWLRQPPPPFHRAGPPAPEREPVAGGASEHAEVPGLYAGRVEVGDLLAPLAAPGHGLALIGNALAAGGEFEYTCGALGLANGDTRTLAVMPDRTRQTLLLLPEDVSEPNMPSYQRMLGDTLVALATALGGRLVAIFPSHAALRATYSGVRQTLERRDVLVLAQGLDGSVRQLWQSFRSQPRVVLLGAGTFWDGAELDGTPPACILVARLPFPSLSDPLLGARADTWQDPQSQFVVPHAALRLRQALNGLAWSQRARNAVVLFDRRVLARGYGTSVLATLPRCTVRHEPMAQLADQVLTWVDGTPSA